MGAAYIFFNKRLNTLEKLHETLGNCVFAIHCYFAWQLLTIKNNHKIPI